jgi:hypothetical protein
MSYDDDLTASKGADEDDEYGSDELDLDDDLDSDDDEEMDWDENDEEPQG